jgi:predicted nucleic acid-binding protein
MSVVPTQLQDASKPLLLDTNILIYHLQGSLPEELKLKMLEAIELEAAHISIITRIELFAWKGFTPESLAKAQAMVEYLAEEPLIDAIANETIAIRREFNLKLPDAVIAATALCNGWTLVTANSADFKRVTGLSLMSVAA